MDLMEDSSRLDKNGLVWSTSNCGKSKVNNRFKELKII